MFKMDIKIKRTGLRVPHTRVLLGVHNLKCLRLMKTGCKEIRIRKLDFEAIYHFLSLLYFSGLFCSLVCWNWNWCSEIHEELQLLEHSSRQKLVFPVHSFRQELNNKIIRLLHFIQKFLYEHFLVSEIFQERLLNSSRICHACYKTLSYSGI